MRDPVDLSKDEIRELLGKGWLTHDGMWFYHTFKEFGIEVANRLNKAAIKSQAIFEMQRAKRALGIDQRDFTSFEEFLSFARAAMNLTLPNSILSRISFTSPRKNLLRWEWESHECFAYKGMKQLGVLDGYECGVIYRIECWFDSLGIEFKVDPRLSKCIMHQTDSCRGKFEFFFQ
jgi:hypothetical protein